MNVMLLALAFASGAQDVSSWPVPLQAYWGATMHGTPFKAECFGAEQAAWGQRIRRRFEVAEKKLIARYGEEKVNNSAGIVIEGAVKIWAPCDEQKQSAYLARVDASVAELEKALK